MFYNYPTISQTRDKNFIYTSNRYALQNVNSLSFIITWNFSFYFPIDVL